VLRKVGFLLGHRFVQAQLEEQFTASQNPASDRLQRRPAIANPGLMKEQASFRGRGTKVARRHLPGFDTPARRSCRRDNWRGRLGGCQIVPVRIVVAIAILRAIRPPTLGASQHRGNLYTPRPDRL
jgi:hypothetical protein